MITRTKQEENEVGSPSYLQRLTDTPKDFFREFSSREREAMIGLLTGEFHWLPEVKCVDDFHLMSHQYWLKMRGIGRRSIERLLKRGWVTIVPPKKSKNAELKELISMRDRAREWATMPDEKFRFICGEVTAQEIRTVRSVLAALLAE